MENPTNNRIINAKFVTIIVLSAITAHTESCKQLHYMITAMDIDKLICQFFNMHTLLMSNHRNLIKPAFPITIISHAAVYTVNTLNTELQTHNRGPLHPITSINQQKPILFRHYVKQALVKVRATDLNTT